MLEDAPIVSIKKLNKGSVSSARKFASMDKKKARAISSTTPRTLCVTGRGNVGGMETREKFLMGQKEKAAAQRSLLEGVK